jgi:hypothetical protein
MGKTRHFHVVFDVRVLDLNLSIDLLAEFLMLARADLLKRFNFIDSWAHEKMLRLF